MVLLLVRRASRRDGDVAVRTRELVADHAWLRPPRRWTRCEHARRPRPRPTSDLFALAVAADRGDPPRSVRRTPVRARGARATRREHRHRDRLCPLARARARAAGAAAANSSTCRLAWEVAGDGVAILAPLLLAGGLVASAVAVRRSSAASRTEMVIACALALAVAAAPYAHTYDHLALFPAWLLVLRAANTRSRGLRTVGSLAVILAALGYGWSAYLVGAAGFRAAVAVTPFLAIALCASVAQRPELQPGTTHPRY